MKTELTDEQVVRMLAEREGWTDVKACSNVPDYYGNHPKHEDRKGPFFVPLYLTSRDALAPVLEGLSEAEWNELTRRLHRQSMAGIHSSPALAYRKLTIYLLTLPASDLAHAVAEVLANKEETK